LAGLLDGRARFKKIRRSPILKKKIVLALLFLGFSLGLAVIVWTKTFDDSLGFDIWVTVLALGTFVCSFVLGLLGTKVAGGIMPGD
jgi:hypothetical protein